MNKITLDDNMMQAMTKLSEGNPGALTVCMAVLKNGSAIDPDSALGGFGALLSLDSIGIYGSKIWMLYKDFCGSHLPSMLAVLRAHQLGFISTLQLMTAIENRGQGLDVTAICQQVKERLPNFVLSEASAA